MTYSVVIPSRNADNLATCLDSIFRLEPKLPPSSIVVIDDGIHKAFRAATRSITWIEGVKPFIFSRNANLGLERGGDIILMNDDSRLLTPFGFTRMVSERPPQYGLVSAAIRENVGNWAQKPAGTNAFRQIFGAMAFICVLIPQTTVQTIGMLDERYVAYGSDDNDYCRRAHQAQLAEAVCDFCIVAHDGKSTFRTQADNVRQLERGREIYRQKWGVRP